MPELPQPSPQKIRRIRIRIMIPQQLLEPKLYMISYLRKVFLFADQQQPQLFPELQEPLPQKSRIRTIRMIREQQLLEPK